MAQAVALKNVLIVTNEDNLEYYDNVKYILDFFDNKDSNQYFETVYNPMFTKKDTEPVAEPVADLFGISQLRQPRMTLQQPIETLQTPIILNTQSNNNNYVFYEQYYNKIDYLCQQRTIIANYELVLFYKISSRSERHSVMGIKPGCIYHSLKDGGKFVFTIDINEPVTIPNDRLPDIEGPNYIIFEEQAKVQPLNDGLKWLKEKRGIGILPVTIQQLCMRYFYDERELMSTEFYDIMNEWDRYFRLESVDVKSIKMYYYVKRDRNEIKIKNQNKIEGGKKSKCNRRQRLQKSRRQKSRRQRFQKSRRQRLRKSRKRINKK